MKSKKNTKNIKKSNKNRKITKKQIKKISKSISNKNKFTKKKYNGGFNPLNWIKKKMTTRGYNVSNLQIPSGNYRPINIFEEKPNKTYTNPNKTYTNPEYTDPNLEINNKLKIEKYQRDDLIQKIIGIIGNNIIFDINKVAKYIFDDLNYLNNNNTKQKNNYLMDYLINLDNLQKIYIYLENRFKQYSKLDPGQIEDKIKELSYFINNSQNSKDFQDLSKTFTYRSKLLLLLEILSIIKIEIQIQLNNQPTNLNTKFIFDIVFKLFINKTKDRLLAETLTNKYMNLLLLNYDPIKYNFLNYETMEQTNNRGNNTGNNEGYVSSE